MKIKVKDIELDLPNDVGVEISEDGKRIVVSQRPAEFRTIWQRPYEVTWPAPYDWRGPTCSAAEATK